MLKEINSKEDQEYLSYFTRNKQKSAYEINDNGYLWRK
ncbi:hypothetical protein [Bacillus testis]